MPALPTRAQVPVAETWDLAAIYATPDDWQAGAGHLAQEVAAVSAYRGRLHEGANVLLACLRASDALSDRLQRLVAYAHLSAAADGLSPHNQAMAARVGLIKAASAAAQSFLSTELAALPNGTVSGYLRDEPALETYRHWLERALRLAAHAMAPAAEEVLAALGDALDAPYTVYQRTTGMDLACPAIQDANGQEVSVSIARYVFGLAQAADRGCAGGPTRRSPPGSVPTRPPWPPPWPPSSRATSRSPDCAATPPQRR